MASRERVNFQAILDCKAGQGNLMATFSMVDSWLTKRGIEHSMPRNPDGPIILNLDMSELEKGVPTPRYG